MGEPAADEGFCRESPHLPVLHEEQRFPEDVTTEEKAVVE
jgi:hypothetical protein